jgi:hypothetical protein
VGVVRVLVCDGVCWLVLDEVSFGLSVLRIILLDMCREVLVWWCWV